MIRPTKKINIRDVKKIINRLNACKNNNMSTEDAMEDIIIYSLQFFYPKVNLTELTDKEKKKMLETTPELIFKNIEKYKKNQVVRAEQNKLYIEVGKNTYISNYINIELYYQIMNGLKNDNIDDLIEKVIYALFKDILNPDILTNIKETDYIYWEIIKDDASMIILNTIKEISEIKQIKNPVKEEKNNIDISISDEISIYSLMLENFHLSKFEVDKNSAVNIFKMINQLSRNGIKKDIDDNISNAEKNGLKGFELQAYKEQLYSVFK